ncbi:TetR/AcrR family transcriptional regulator [Aequorivita echinoideorum]|uniref:TetR/AcrR family transcriptional regulator n=1 Tax=Aequorivita echinoideorum TaxID=1549647 RepID=A0ABS5S7D6_9FLAO|nr:TetR family transcriptional regulator C-terminal domain-containing protein [Aequorivita echinoideorum]MBT0608339.1 TetR/AcrR family transcriptional regulator [Aequorivita echinoideorum]
MVAKKVENKAKQSKITAEKIISIYMESVLEHEHVPTSVYKFCKENNITEAEFYEFFGSFDGLRKEIWNSFYQQTILLINKDAAFETYTNKEKMLTFFYTFFELLTMNRSYVLFALKENKNVLKNLEQLKGLRKNVKDFASELIREKNDEKKVKVLKHSVTVFSEGAWLQTLFILKYWMDDNSAGFENTDLVIEKSVRAIFDVFETTPLESVLDFGKFLWKEKMA